MFILRRTTTATCLEKENAQMCRFKSHSSGQSKPPVAQSNMCYVKNEKLGFLRFSIETENWITDNEPTE